VARERVRRSRRAFGQRPGVVAWAALLWPLLLFLPLLFGAAGAISAVRLEKPAHSAAAQVAVNPMPVILLVSGGPFGVGDRPRPRPRFEGANEAVARGAWLVERVLRAANVSGLTAAEFLDHSRVTARSERVYDLSVTSTSSATAIRLANIYASEYANLQNRLGRGSIDAALRSLRARIASLPHTGPSPLRATLVQQAKQLSQLLRPERSSVLQKASATTPVRKHEVRNHIIGGLLGLLFAIALLLGLLRRFPALRPPRSPSIRTSIAGGMWDCNCRTCQEQRKAPLEVS
jgi:hypothetical protein